MFPTRVFSLVLTTSISILFISCFFIRCASPEKALIGNGGFDIVTRCPSTISQLRLAQGWSSSGSPDLFCACTRSGSPVYAKLSFVGSLQPVSGDCYAGFIVSTRYKEYLTFELPQKMRRRAIYCFRFLYARSLYSGVRAEKLGIYLHRDPLGNSARGQPLHTRSAEVRIADRPGVWTETSFTFTCKGGERYISIGSFADDLKSAECISPRKNRKTSRIFNYARSGYYFIEDIRLTRLRKGETCETVPIPADTIVESPVVTEDPVETDTVKSASAFVLQDLNFETNSCEILPSSFEELDELAAYLSMQPELNVFISGHTDDRGNEEANRSLSEARALSVVDYLRKKGISGQRLSWQGYGQTRPIADNETDEGRLQNRRVEFLVY